MTLLLVGACVFACALVLVGVIGLRRTANKLAETAPTPAPMPTMELDEHKQLAVLWERWARHADDILEIRAFMRMHLLGIGVVLVVLFFVVTLVMRLDERQESIVRALDAHGIRVAMKDTR